jgi:methylenetetrahydrofolate reductase (NADPH)
MNKFSRALLSDRLIVTAECLPPRGSDPEAVRRLSSMLPSSLDAVVIGDNPDQIRSSAFSAAMILGKEGRPSVILSMATRDRNRIALLSDVMGAAALDIAAILCMSGSHQSSGVCPQAAAANDLDSVQFTQAMKKMILDGAEFHSRDHAPKLKFQVGAVAHPYLRPMDLNLICLKKKIVAGADFLMTQAVFDIAAFRQWMDAVRAAGLENRTAIFATVLPLAGVERALELQRRQTYGPIADHVIDRIRKAGDAAEEGAAIAAEMAAQLKDIPGVRGVHILSGGCESVAAAVMGRAGI